MYFTILYYTVCICFIFTNVMYVTSIYGNKYIYIYMRLIEISHSASYF